MAPKSAMKFFGTPKRRWWLGTSSCKRRSRMVLHSRRLVILPDLCHGRGRGRVLLIRKLLSRPPFPSLSLRTPLLRLLHPQNHLPKYRNLMKKRASIPRILMLCPGERRTSSLISA
ncbi:uncharacterized protein DS421_5g143530 [Arachis hypogaea]|nr:uncharacterized protein DS421_5g143530 [Arachis hypogaea]